MKENLKSVAPTAREIGVFRVRIQMNAPRLMIDNLHTVPNQFKAAGIAKIAWRDLPDLLNPLVRFDVDKTELGKHMKAGKTIPGAHWEQGESIRIV